MRHLRASIRLLRALMHVLSGWWTIRRRFAVLDEQQQAREVEAWSRGMLQVLGVTLEVRGTPPTRGPALLVCNHVSWLDILSIHAARHVRFVSKAGVRHWPLIGTLSTGAGSLYIERERRRDALRVVHHMTQALADGDLIAVFPEGTTGDGSRLLPFHANLLQAAISSGAPVQPCALRFAQAATGETSRAPLYIDDDTLVASLWRVLTSPPLRAVLCFGELQPSAGRDRRAWAHSLHRDVRELFEKTR